MTRQRIPERIVSERADAAQRRNAFQQQMLLLLRFCIAVMEGAGHLSLIHISIYSKALRKSPAEFFAAIKSGRRFASQHAVVFLSNVIHHSTTMSEDDCHAKCCEKQYIYSRILLIWSPQKQMCIRDRYQIATFFVHFLKKP